MAAVPRVLITGAGGQLGLELSAALRAQYGAENVLCTDCRPASKELLEAEPFRYLNVCEPEDFNRICTEFRPTWLIHFAALLSAIGEKNPEKALQVNMRGTENALKAAKDFGCRIFVPSSIGAFGPTTPRFKTPDITVQRPRTIYGVSKVYTELLGEWYHKAFGVDFRCLRYPGIISWKTLPGGGTTDWSCAAYFECLAKKSYECFLGPDTKMPLMYMPDCIKSTLQFLTADDKKLTQRTYNVVAVSFSPAEQAEVIREFYPEYKITYKPDFRQGIADSWPVDLDDTQARKDWGWSPDFDLRKMSADIFANLKKA